MSTRFQATLPKFVIADDGINRDFAIHLHCPRFVLEIEIYANGSIRRVLPFWLDAEPNAIESQRLLKQAAAFFTKQMANSKSAN